MALLCVLCWFPAAVEAQTVGGVLSQLTAPRGWGALTAFRTTLDIDYLTGTSADHRFNWDVDMALDVDLFDVGAVRGNLFGNFETIIGGELRDVDPNQTNYMTDLSFFTRLPHGELGATFHHVSRHLSDRADRGSISWNMVGVSYGNRFTIGAVDIDAGGRGMATVERAGVDYLAQFEGYAHLAVPVDQRLAIISTVEGVLAPVENDMFDRQTQKGGRVLGGLRVKSGVGAIDLFVAWEQRIDTDAFSRETGRFVQLGFRLRSFL